MRLIFLLACLFMLPSRGETSCTVETALNHPITAITLDIVKNTIKFAKQENCGSILFTVDTPGGSLPATRAIIQEILNSPYPVLCLISPPGGQATSAGAIILQSCHINGALKGTNMGAATPVTMGQQMEKESDMRKKMLNDTIAFVETLTSLRKRNKDFGKDIVSEAKSVTAKEAYKLKAIDFLGERKEDFLTFANGRTVEMAEGRKTQVQTGMLKVFRQSIRYSVLNFFADPQLLYLLFLGSIGLIYFELTHPGMLLPGVIGGIGLIIAFIGLNMMSVTWGALALIFLGICLFIAEVFMPSFGILGIGGGISFILGSFYLFDPVKTGYTLPLSLILPAAGFIALLCFALSFLALRTFKMRKDKTGFDALEGKEGSVTELSKKEQSQEGWVFLNGENWKFSSVDNVKKGDTVKVLSVKGMTLKVKKVEEEF